MADLLVHSGQQQVDDRLIAEVLNGQDVISKDDLQRANTRTGHERTAYSCCKEFGRP